MSQGKALDQAYAQMANGDVNAPFVTFNDFQNFINANDLEEALGFLTGAWSFHFRSFLCSKHSICVDQLHSKGQSGPVIIDTNVERADAEKMAAQFGGHKAVKAGEIEYREYYE